MNLCSQIGHYWVTVYRRYETVQKCAQCYQQIIVDEADHD